MWIVLALGALGYWLIGTARYGLRVSVFYFWPLLAGYLGAIAAFPSLRLALLLPLSLGALLFLVFVVALTCAKPTPVGPTEAIVVLGIRRDRSVPACIFRSRVDRAMVLAREHPEAAVIVSGGAPCHQCRSEASVMAEALIARGLDPKRLICEDKSRTTRENLTHALALVPKSEKGVCIVTSDFHLFRTRALARSLPADRELFFAAAKTPCHLLMPHYLLRELFTFATEAVRGNIKPKP